MDSEIKLFTCGPVQMYPSTADIRNKGFIYFRTPEYGDMVKDTLGRLSTLLGNSVEGSLIYLAASGTGAMEATVENCVSLDDKCLVINGGGFGKRFCELLKYHNKIFDSVDINWNETLTAEHLKPFENKGFTTLFVNIHETSTGQLYDIKMLSEFCKRNGMFLIVDAISSFLADEYNMERYGIDVTIISSQKGLCCSPGMSLVSFSNKMIEKINNGKQMIGSKYFDFKDYFVNMQRGQTPYTPPVMVMYEIKDIIDLIDNAGGLQSWLSDIKRKAQYFREGCKEYGLKIPNYPLSDMLTPIIFEDISARDVIQVLKDKYKIYVNPCGGDLSDKMFRVCHLGNVSLNDIDYLLEKLKLSIEEVKNKELCYDRK